MKSLFTEPTIGIYRECTGRDRIDRHWWKVAKELMAEAAFVFASLAALYVLFHVF